MSGVSGELRRGYRVVAYLGNWSMDGSGRAEADINELDEFELEQADSFTLWLRVGRKIWAWREATIRSNGGGRLVLMTKGSPDVRDVG